MMLCKASLAIAATCSLNSRCESQIGIGSGEVQFPEKAMVENLWIQFQSGPKHNTVTWSCWAESECFSLPDLHSLQKHRQRTLTALFGGPVSVKIFMTLPSVLSLPRGFM